MIGVNLNLDLPTLDDTFATIVAKTITALDAIQVSIADKATPSALNINSALSMGGNRLVNLASATLVDGNFATSAGSFYYHQGEFYLVDATGVVQVTKVGALNISGSNGIGGDYGGTNPALVSYDNATGQYRFYTNPGTPTWADVVANDFRHEGAWEVPISRAGWYEAHGTFSLTRTPADASGQLPANGVAPTTGPWTWQSDNLPIRVGDRVVGIKIYWNNKSAGSTSVWLSKILSGVQSTVSTETDIATGAGTVTYTVASPVATAVGEDWMLFIEPPGSPGSGTASGDNINHIALLVDHP